MEIRVHGRKLDVSDRIRTQATKRVTCASKFFDRVGDADVEILEEPGPRSGERFRAEISAPAAGLIVRAEGTGETIQNAIDAAADRFGSNLRRLNDRFSDRRKGASEKR